MVVAHSCCEGTPLVEAGQTIVAVSGPLGERHKAEGGTGGGRMKGGEGEGIIIIHTSCG